MTVALDDDGVLLGGVTHVSGPGRIAELAVEGASEIPRVVV
ncbi:MAG: hypothetical protein ACYDH6_03115 [Acidimicrobiales bacterium]